MQVAARHDGNARRRIFCYRRRETTGVAPGNANKNSSHTHTHARAAPWLASLHCMAFFIATGERLDFDLF